MHICSQSHQASILRSELAQAKNNSFHRIHRSDPLESRGSLASASVVPLRGPVDLVVMKLVKIVCSTLSNG
jgi:hypothetical protein